MDATLEEMEANRLQRELERYYEEQDRLADMEDM